MKSKIEITKADECSYDGTNADRYSAEDITTSSQTIANPNVSGSAFGVYPDSVGMDLSSENKLLAVFKYEEQARIFGAKMWGRMYIVKELQSEHFC